MKLKTWHWLALAGIAYWLYTQRAQRTPFMETVIPPPSLPEFGYGASARHDLLTNPTARVQ